MAQYYQYHLGLDVGQPYLPGHTSWREHVEYNGFRNNRHYLRMFLNGLTPAEIRDVREGEAEFALYVEKDAIFFLYRFGSAFPWSDAPYSIYLTNEPDREVPEPGAAWNSRDPLLVVLVDAASGIVQGVRDLWLSPDFTKALRSAIAQQARRPWPGDQAYNSQIQDIYRRFPQPVELVHRAAAQTKGYDQ